MKKYKYLNMEKENGIGTIRFCRPDQLNAMNRNFMNEIILSLAEMNDDDEIKVVILTGSGRAFMAGADIKEYATQTDAEFMDFQKRGVKLYEGIEHSAKPYIAMVDGYALGGGFEIACACDLIIASENSTFGLPEVHLGLVPGGGGTQRLIQKIGINRIKEMLYLGGSYSAETMYNWGIINYITSKENLEEKTFEIAKKLTRRPSAAIGQLKRLANLSTSPIDFDKRIYDEGETVFNLFKTDIAKELINKFIKK